MLPLRNLTGDPSNDYFSEGLTESLITALSRVGNLKVVPRGTAARAIRAGRVDCFAKCPRAARARAPQHSVRVARVYSSLWELDAAFKSLDKAFVEREENLVWLKVDPQLDNLRPDPQTISCIVLVSRPINRELRSPGRSRQRWGCSQHHLIRPFL